MSAQFKLRGGVPDRHAKEQAALIARELGLPRFVASVMVSRGIDTPQAARDFIEPSLERDWRNPYEIEGMKEVVDALEEAVKGRKHIVVFGDFDLDGISATTVMTRGIRALGGQGHAVHPQQVQRRLRADARRARAREADRLRRYSDGGLRHIVPRGSGRGARRPACRSS